MTKEAWIVIGIAAVQTAATIIGVVISWRLSRKQIQIMLAQTKPAAKTTQSKTFWLPIIGFFWCAVAVPTSIVSIAYVLWFDSVSRSTSVFLAWCAFCLPINLFGAWFWFHEPWREKVPSRNQPD